ncbi:MAG: HAD family phosphatase [Caldilineaceae bacterium]
MATESSDHDCDSRLSTLTSLSATKTEPIGKAIAWFYSSMSINSRTTVADTTIRAVLFDRDGVLTSFDLGAAARFFQPLLPISVLELSKRWQAFGEATGFPRNSPEEKLFFAAFWQQLGDEFSLSSDQRARLECLDYARFVVPYPEVQSVLTQLRMCGIQLGVLSNFSLASLEHSLVITGLAPYFSTMCAAPVIGAAKPSPQAYEIALNGLGVNPQECLFFDDEIECVEGARQIGMRAYMVNRRAPVHSIENAIVADLVVVPSLVRHE